MIKTVIDTSSLISLEVAGVLKKSLNVMKPTVPKAVVDELKKIGKYSDTEGKAAKKILYLIEQKKITPIEIKDKDKIRELLSLDGEAESFVCCEQEGIDRLIMKDVDASHKLESRTIAKEIKISPAVVIELEKKH